MTHETEGYFWLPSQPENEVGGRLTINSEGSASLDLLGAFDTGRDVSRVAGRCGDGLYTFDNCYVQQTQLRGPIETQRIYSGRIIAGVAYDEGEIPRFDRVDISLTTLLDWIQLPHIAEDIDFSPDADGRERRISLALESWARQEISITGGRLHLGQSRGVAGDGLRERKLIQGASLSVLFNERLTLEDVLDVTSDLQDLVSIGTDRTAAYEHVHLYDPEIGLGSKKDGRFAPPAKLFLPWLAQPDTDKSTPHQSDMAFTFQDINGMDGLAGWLTVAAKYRSMLGHVMTTRYVKMLVDVKLVFRVAALNGLFREWKGYECNLRSVLTKLAVLAGDPFAKLVHDVDAWCDKATKERTNLAHHYGRPAHSNSAEMYFTAESAYWLFVLCMLRLADAPETAFDRIVVCPQFKWLSGQMPR